MNERYAQIKPVESIRSECNVVYAQDTLLPLVTACHGPCRGSVLPLSSPDFTNSKCQKVVSGEGEGPVICLWRTER